jgi:hypothetical protein
MKEYVPASIDLDKLISDHQMSNIKGFHSDKLICILSEIAKKPCNTDGYAEIHSKRLQSFVHN